MFENLTPDRRRVLLNKLVVSGDLEALGKDFNLVIPRRMTVQYKCPSCDSDFSNRLLTADMKGMRKYLSCPDCKQKAYLADIGARKKPTRATEVDIDEFFKT